MLYGQPNFMTFKVHIDRLAEVFLAFVWLVTKFKYIHTIRLNLSQLLPSKQG